MYPIVVLIHLTALKYPFTKCNMPGNVNFDPLRLSSTDLTYKRLFSSSSRDAFEILKDYREAELKHGRLAMLASIAYPVQEVLQPRLSEQLSLPSMLSGQLSPSLVNGNLDPSIIIWLIGLGSGLELGYVMNENKMIGDYGWGKIFAPGISDTSLFKLQSGEVWNGRIAMIAILAYIVQEAVTGNPVLYFLK